MGRELRMVPPHWDHPKVRRNNGRMAYQPMHDQSYEEASKEWKEGFKKWEEEPLEDDMEYWEYAGTLSGREYYRPWSSEAATWFQVWETVSEGTPVTPPFETKQELIEYLVANGDFWDQERRKERCTDMECGPWTREQAEKFVNGTGFAVTLVVDENGPRLGHKA